MKEQKYLFHPFELAFCGYSGSGKTTLIEKLVGRLSSKFRLAYGKHDAHHFEIDYPGKDTERIYRAGAVCSFIADSKHYALHRKGDCDFWAKKELFLDADWLFIEGYKNTTLPKIIMLHAKQSFESLSDFMLDNVIAFVGVDDKPPMTLPDGSRYFCRDDDLAIAELIVQYFKRKANEVPLLGLVLAGGQSRRMQQDKALLNYHGEPQVLYMAKLLEPYCQQVYISEAGQNRVELLRSAYPIIQDAFPVKGPMAGILSAMTCHREAAWLVVGCDMPFLDQSIMEHLLAERNPFRMASFFVTGDAQLPEPLCAVYEPKIFSRLLQAFAYDIRCPRKILQQLSTQQVVPSNPQALANINAPDERKWAYTQLQKKHNKEGEIRYGL